MIASAFFQSLSIFFYGKLAEEGSLPIPLTACGEEEE
jgi:hypothetical protein